MAQFVYRMECALDGPKDRIALRASVFCLLQNFHTGSGAHTATCLICTRRPVREPNKSPPSSAEAMMLSTKVPLVLRFELNEKLKVRAVCVCVCVCVELTCAVNRGLVGVRIVTALLVKVSVLRDVV